MLCAPRAARVRRPPRIGLAVLDDAADEHAAKGPDRPAPPPAMSPTRSRYRRGARQLSYF